MPAEGLGLTHVSYADDDILMAQMQLWVENRLRPQIFNGTEVLKLIAGRDISTEMTLDDIEASGALDMRDGGASIDIPLLTQNNSTIMSFEGYQPLAVDPQTIGGPSFVQWREYAVSIMISRRERLLNKNSKSRVFALQDAKEMQAEMEIQDRLNSDLVKGDQNVSALGKSFTTDVEGISYFIEEDPVGSTNTVAGVVRNAANSWHRNQFNGTSQSVTSTTPAFDTEGVKDIDLLTKDAARGPGLDEVDCFLTTPDVHTFLWDYIVGSMPTKSNSGIVC